MAEAQRGKGPGPIFSHDRPLFSYPDRFRTEGAFSIVRFYRTVSFGGAVPNRQGADLFFAKAADIDSVTAGGNTVKAGLSKARRRTTR